MMWPIVSSFNRRKKLTDIAQFTVYTEIIFFNKYHKLNHTHFKSYILNLEICIFLICMCVHLSQKYHEIIPFLCLAHISITLKACNR